MAQLAHRALWPSDAQDAVRSGAHLPGSWGMGFKGSKEGTEGYLPHMLTARWGTAAGHVTGGYM